MVFPLLPRVILDGIPPSIFSCQVRKIKFVSCRSKGYIDAYKFYSNASTRAYGTFFFGESFFGGLLSSGCSSMYFSMIALDCGSFNFFCNGSQSLLDSGQPLYLTRNNHSELPPRDGFLAL